MIKPRIYRKYYRNLKLFEKNKDLFMPKMLVAQAVRDLTFRQKLYVFLTILFK